jgi:hypothetical protein
VRTENEMSNESAKANVVIARRALDTMKSGDLVHRPLRQQAATSQTNTESVKALNGIARGVMESLQAGDQFKGTVVSYASVGGVEVARVALEIPMLGERQVLVRDEHDFAIGQEVAVECVHNESKPSRFVFRMANGALTPANGNGGSNGPRRQ